MYKEKIKPSLSRWVWEFSEVIQVESLVHVGTERSHIQTRFLVAPPLSRGPNELPILSLATHERLWPPNHMSHLQI